jgi:hypothetical protein
MSHIERPRIRTTTKFGGSSPGHSESSFCSSVTKVTELILLQTSHSPLTITTETICLSITGDKDTVVSRHHMFTCSFSPSPCCVFMMFRRLDDLFFCNNRYVIQQTGFFLDFLPNVEVCQNQLKTGIQFLTGFHFGPLPRIQLKSSKVM